MFVQRREGVLQQPKGRLCGVPSTPMSWRECEAYLRLSRLLAQGQQIAVPDHLVGFFELDGELEPVPRSIGVLGLEAGNKASRIFASVVSPPSMPPDRGLSDTPGTARHPNRRSVAAEGGVTLIA